MENAPQLCICQKHENKESSAVEPMQNRRLPRLSSYLAGDQGPGHNLLQSLSMT